MDVKHLNIQLQNFTSHTRLYSLDANESLQHLHVERWTGRERLSELYQWDILALSTEDDLPLNDLLGQPVRLLTTLADGSRCARSGLVAQARQLSSDGSVTRYYLQLVPWLWMLSQSVHCRVFQDMSVSAIVHQVLSGYSALAHWRFDAYADRLLESARIRSYCTQYRESDYGFLQRLLAEEGLGFCFVEHEDAHSGHSLWIFGESPVLDQDPSSAVPYGIRFHPASGVEEHDSVLHMGQVNRLGATRITRLSSDYKSRQAITGSGSTADGVSQTGREDYDPAGDYAFANWHEAEHYTQLNIAAADAANRFWKGFGNVRSARAGTWFELQDTPWSRVDHLRGIKEFLYTEVLSYGINNLPESVPDLEPIGDDLLGLDAFDEALIARARSGGYAQHFKAVQRERSWRPTLEDGTGQLINPRPTALGAQSAIVIGPDGNTTPGATGPLHCDALGRVRVRFHWQTGDDRGSCWLRVGQRSAGQRLGAQFLPRIGQEVLVEFASGDIDRPVILSSLYNGQGEGGVMPSPGGKHADPTDFKVYQSARDHHSSAWGNIKGGNSPAWHAHGHGENRHRNATALSGFKTKGFDGQGFNQLVFDDSDQQGRVQLATTQAHSQLNLGHLIHQADNYRGSFRGLGFELRSDAYGAIRAQKGLLLSTYGITPQTPAGDASAAQVLLQQQRDRAQRFDLAAQVHHCVGLSSHRGIKAARQSRLIADQAPLHALHTSLSTTVTGGNFEQAKGEAVERLSSSGDNRLPHSGDALLTLSAQGSQALLAGQSMLHSAGETLTLSSGKDSSFAVGEHLRLHSGQAIGYLAGAENAEGVGLSVVTGAGPLDLQAQQKDIVLHAQADFTLVSLNAETELAAGKAIRLSVGGGSSLTLEGGNVSLACEGTIKVHAGGHVYDPATNIDRSLPVFPEAVCVKCMAKIAAKQRGSFAELQ